MVEEGKKAPGFSLPNATGETINLSDFKGQNVVLYFYPKDNTPGCTKQACGFRDASEEYDAVNAVVIGISPDNEASHQKFRDKFELPFLLLADPDRKAIEAYGVWKEKNMYGKKYMGVERSTFIIDKDGVTVKIIRKVKVEGHVESVLSMLSE
ncbi:MAG: thioredoxin-dependent thiol peroxidase [Candidatus Latescibacterota bacterium]|nr:thioredoxin-dependent thiol peroxidase [Candidatus Latescibacterota bacterium]